MLQFEEIDIRCCDTIVVSLVLSDYWVDSVDPQNQVVILTRMVLVAHDFMLLLRGIHDFHICRIFHALFQTMIDFK